MSLTTHIKNKTKLYYFIYDNLDIDNINGLIHKFSNLKNHYPFIDGENFSVVGMSVIYAVREYLFGKNSIKETIAGNIDYEPNFGNLAVDAVCNSMRDNFVRKKISPSSLKKSIKPDLKPTVDSVENIIKSFNDVLGNITFSCGYVNPTFELSSNVGGADANFILDDTIFQVITSGKRNPLTLDKIIQPIGYYFLDNVNKYKLKKISWYLTRQKIIVTANINYLLWDTSIKLNDNMINDKFLKSNDSLLSLRG